MEPQQSMPSMSLPPINNTAGGGDPSSQDNTAVGPKEAIAVPSEQPLSSPADDAGGHGISAPQIADDVDLIEKEWVRKIQEIIQKTHDDPYERARQIALLKTEYLQKR